MAKLEELIILANNSEGREQRGFLKKTRAQEELTREQVAAIKRGRRRLRWEMRKQGIEDKEEFELTAAEMGLYFDKSRGAAWLAWFFHGKGLWALLGALLLLLLVMFLFSIITQLQGHFTINMSDGLFQEGFVLSETADFANPMTHLFCQPAENIPCISISNLPENLDTIDGQHNSTYFAYTFYCRNEGASTVGYEWQVNVNSESKQLSKACWVMIFEDGKMCFYAAPNTKTGEQEMLPARNDNSRGYIRKPLEMFSLLPDQQYEVITQKKGYEFTRVIPVSFLTDWVVATGMQEDVKPGEVHKYTVVIWLEGDDPDCNDDLIGGHVGMEMFFQMMGEEEANKADGNEYNAHRESLWDSLKFWSE